MTNKNNNPIKDQNGKDIFTKEYRSRREDRNEFLIQDHSAGHPQMGGEAARPHYPFND